MTTLSNVSFKEFCENLCSLFVLSTIIMFMVTVVDHLNKGSNSRTNFPSPLQLMFDNTFYYQLFISYFYGFILILIYSRMTKNKLLPDILDENSCQIISIGTAILFGFNLYQGMNIFTFFYGIVTLLNLTYNCEYNFRTNSMVIDMRREIHFLQSTMVPVRAYQSTNLQQDKKETIREMSDIIFELKEKIPDGSYLELMDKIKSLYD